MYQYVLYIFRLQSLVTSLRKIPRTKEILFQTIDITFVVGLLVIVFSFRILRTSRYTNIIWLKSERDKYAPSHLCPIKPHGLLSSTF
jgi:hypothetical protein